jgi:ADP-ribose pyrophosphatase YjhB (NUDIX family)
MAVCNHTSVGMIVERDGKLLLIERKIFPLTYAFPAGHVDEGETYEHAAARELKEEVGLDTKHIELIAEGRVENPCSREGGTWHAWKVYRIDADGEIQRSEEETTQAGWYTKEEINHLPPPGFEPVMLQWYQEKGIL